MYESQYTFLMFSVSLRVICKNGFGMWVSFLEGVSMFVFEEVS